MNLPSAVSGAKNSEHMNSFISSTESESEQKKPYRPSDLTKKVRTEAKRRLLLKDTV